MREEAALFLEDPPYPSYRNPNFAMVIQLFNAIDTALSVHKVSFACHIPWRTLSHDVRVLQRFHWPWISLLYGRYSALFSIMTFLLKTTEKPLESSQLQIYRWVSEQNPAQLGLFLGVGVYAFPSLSYAMQIWSQLPWNLTEMFGIFGTLSLEFGSNGSVIVLRPAASLLYLRCSCYTFLIVYA